MVLVSTLEPARLLLAAGDLGEPKMAHSDHGTAQTSDIYFFVSYFSPLAVPRSVTIRLWASGLGVLFGLLGCSTAQTNVIESRPADCGAAECDAAAAPEPELVLGECFQTNCEGDVEVAQYEPGPTIECEATHLGTGTIAWVYRTDAIDCLTPPCSSDYHSIRVDAAGNLDVAGRLASNDFTDVGLWFARFADDGTEIDFTVVDAAFRTRFTQPSFSLAVGADATGKWFVGKAIGDPNISRVTNYELHRFDEPKVSTLLTAVSDVINVRTAVSLGSDFALLTIWPDIIFDEDDVLAPSNPTRPLDISRFDASGRLLWNQTKLTRALPLTHTNLVGFDAAGNLTIELQQEGNLGFAELPRAPDGTIPALVARRLARLDRDGNLLWVWDVPHSAEGSYAIAPDGAMYVIRQPYDQFYVKQSAVLERLDAMGRSQWILDLGDDCDEVAIDAEGNAVVVLGATWADTSMRFQQVGPNGQRCESFNVPCLEQANGERLCAGDELQVAPDGDILFAVRNAIGRVTRPE